MDVASTCPLRVAEAQEDPAMDDVPWDGDPGASLRVAGERAPLEPRADVILVGRSWRRATTDVTAGHRPW